MMFSNFLGMCHRSASRSRGMRSSARLLPTVGGNSRLRHHRVVTARGFSLTPTECARTDLIGGLRSLNVNHPSACTPAVDAVRRHRCIIGNSGRNRRHACAMSALGNVVVARGAGGRRTNSRGNGLLPASVKVIMGSFLVTGFPGVVSCGFATGMRRGFSSVTRKGAR